MTLRSDPASAVIIREQFFYNLTQVGQIRAAVDDILALPQRKHDFHVVQILGNKRHPCSPSLGMTKCHLTKPCGCDGDLVSMEVDQIAQSTFWFAH
jgi:hypothetical protein